MRRWTGLRPSRTSGSARETITDMEYSRNERSISSWISIGSMNPSTSASSGGAPVPSRPLRRPFVLVPVPLVGGRLAIACVPGWSVVSVVRWWTPSSVCRPAGRSDVEEPDVLCVRLDEVPSSLDVVAHQDRAHVVGERRLLEADLEQRTLCRVDRRVAQLVEVHLAEPLQPLEVVAVVRVLGQERVLGAVVLQVDLVLADTRRVQRRLGHVDESAFDERLHVPEEEGEQQRPDVAPVDVGVVEHDDLVVADLRDVEVLAEAAADRCDQRLDLRVLQHLVDPGPLDVQDLAPDREDRLGSRVPRVLRRATRRVALHDEELALPAVARRTVDELPRQPRAVEPGLAPRQVTRLLGGDAGPLGEERLLHDLVRLGRVLLEPLGELLVGGALDERPDRDVAELRLGLSLELGVLQSYRHDGGEPLADVLPVEVLLLLLQLVARACVAVHDVREGLFEPLLVHATLDRGDTVRKRVDALVEAGVPLERDLHLLVGLGHLVRGDLAEQGLLRGVEVPHVVDDAAAVAEGLLLLAVRTLVHEANLEAFVQEGHHLQTLRDRLRAEFHLFEDRAVR